VRSMQVAVHPWYGDYGPGVEYAGSCGQVMLVPWPQPCQAMVVAAPSEHGGAMESSGGWSDYAMECPQPVPASFATEHPQSQQHIFQWQQPQLPLQRQQQQQQLHQLQPQHCHSFMQPHDFMAPEPLDKEYSTAVTACGGMQHTLPPSPANAAPLQPRPPKVFMYSAESGLEPIGGVLDLDQPASQNCFAPTGDPHQLRTKELAPAVQGAPASESDFRQEGCQHPLKFTAEEDGKRKKTKIFIHDSNGELRHVAEKATSGAEVSLVDENGGSEYLCARLEQLQRHAMAERSKQLEKEQKESRSSSSSSTAKVPPGIIVHRKHSAASSSGPSTIGSSASLSCCSTAPSLSDYLPYGEESQESINRAKPVRRRVRWADLVDAQDSPRSKELAAESNEVAPHGPAPVILQSSKPPVPCQHNATGRSVYSSSLPKEVAKLRRLQSRNNGGPSTTMSMSMAGVAILQRPREGTTAEQAKAPAPDGTKPPPENAQTPLLPQEDAQMALPTEDTGKRPSCNVAATSSRTEAARKPAGDAAPTPSKKGARDFSARVQADSAAAPALAAVSFAVRRQMYASVAAAVGAGKAEAPHPPPACKISHRNAGVRFRPAARRQDPRRSHAPPSNAGSGGAEKSAAPASTATMTPSARKGTAAGNSAGKKKEPCPQTQKASSASLGRTGWLRASASFRPWIVLIALAAATATAIAATVGFVSTSPAAEGSSKLFRFSGPSPHAWLAVKPFAADPNDATGISMADRTVGAVVRSLDVEAARMEAYVKRQHSRPERTGGGRGAPSGGARSLAAMGHAREHIFVAVSHGL